MQQQRDDLPWTQEVGHAQRKVHLQMVHASGLLGGEHQNRCWGSHTLSLQGGSGI